MLSVRTAQPGDAELLAPTLPQREIDAINLLHDIDAITALRFGLKASHPCYAVLSTADNKLLALFGIIPDSEEKGTGRIWLLGNQELIQYQTAFLRRCHHWLDRLQADYPTLWNETLWQDVAHLKWLQWCGFCIVAKHKLKAHPTKELLEFERKGCGKQLRKPKDKISD